MGKKPTSALTDQQISEQVRRQIANALDRHRNEPGGAIDPR